MDAEDPFPNTEDKIVMHSVSDFQVADRTVARPNLAITGLKNDPSRERDSLLLLLHLRVSTSSMYLELARGNCYAYDAIFYGEMVVQPETFPFLVV